MSLNPNAPEHIPPTSTINTPRPIRRLAYNQRVAAWGGKKMFSAVSQTSRDRATDISLNGPRDTWTSPIVVPATSGMSDSLQVTAEGSVGHLSSDVGVREKVMSAHLALICDYANRWHAKASSTGRLFTTLGNSGRPLFKAVPMDMSSFMQSADGPTGTSAQYYAPTPAQFWMLRYLFLPLSISYQAGGKTHNHSALVAISPETRTLEYMDSLLDTSIESMNPGKYAMLQNIRLIIQWMAYFLGDASPTLPRFVPSEWKVRFHRGHQQAAGSVDCALFTLSHAQWMAFGYQLELNEKQSWPEDYTKSMISRRFRLSHDLLEGTPPGFTLWSDSDAENVDALNADSQYYPIIDTPVVLSSARTQWITARHSPEFLNILSPRLRNRRTCYSNCPSKAKLAAHCMRNHRFYPGFFTQNKVNVTLRNFIEWVETMDSRRQHREMKFKPAVKGIEWPPAWIDPRKSHTGRQNGFVVRGERGALWN